MAKKTDAPVESTEVDLDHAETRVYELGFHIDPELSNDDVKKVYQGIRTKVAEVGTIVAEGEPQKIQLAYTIYRSEQHGRHDFDASFFSWIAYEANGAGHEKVTQTAGAETRIFRFIDLRTTKEGAQHSAEMHEIMAKTANATEEGGDEVSDVEIDAALKEVGV